jgi:hypothetical protein
VKRQRVLNEERRRRDEAEVELAADFAVWNEECAAARDAVRVAELAMGRLIDRMIGELRIRYPRAAQLLEMPEDELRRLRQLTADPTSTAKDPGANRGDRKKRKSAAVPRGESRSQHAATSTATGDDRTTVVGDGHEDSASHVEAR